MEPDQGAQARAALAAALNGLAAQNALPPGVAGQINGLPQPVQNAIRPYLGMSNGRQEDFITNRAPLNTPMADDLEIRPPIMGNPAAGPQLLHAPEPSPYRNISFPQPPAQPFGFGSVRGLGI
jgi:hypothetical protein